MNTPRSIARRDVLRRLVVLSLSAGAAPLLAACSRKPSCNDVTGLSPEDVRARNDTAAYTEVAPDPAKACSACAQWVPGGANACGGCKVLKGPINAGGSCKLFAPKPAG